MWPLSTLYAAAYSNLFVKKEHPVSFLLFHVRSYMGQHPLFQTLSHYLQRSPVEERTMRSIVILTDEVLHDLAYFIKCDAIFYCLLPGIFSLDIPAVTAGCPGKCMKPLYFYGLKESLDYTPGLRR